MSSSAVACLFLVIDLNRRTRFIVTACVQTFQLRLAVLKRSLFYPSHLIGGCMRRDTEVSNLFFVVDALAALLISQLALGFSSLLGLL